jgi:hypothetical protein
MARDDSDRLEADADMMTAAGQGDIWVSDPKAYQEKLRNLLGGRDPIEVLSKTADALADIVQRDPAEKMRARPFEGKWTPNEILGHLTDTEWVYGFRIRLVLSEEEPAILGMDQEKWVTAQRHNERAPQELLAMFRSLRGANLVLWKSMSAADLKRVGRHNERGPEPLGLMLTMHAGHDLSHIDQMTRYLRALER